MQGTNDPLLGIVHLGARDYDPASGRFLSPDPVIDSDNPRQWNAYDYGGANPVMNPDPTGEFWPILVIVAVRIVAPHIIRVVAPVVARVVTRYVAPAVAHAVAAARPHIARAVSTGVRAVRSAFKPRSVSKAPKKVRTTSIRRGTAKQAPKSSARAPKSHSRGPATKGAARSKANNAGRSKNAVKSSIRRVKSSSIRAKTSTSSVKGRQYTLKKGKSLNRVSQDRAVKPKPPGAKSLQRPIARSVTQNRVLQDRIAYLQSRGASELRVNQQQVNYAGQRVGTNRPDLQYNLNGRRFYEEFDTPASDRGMSHMIRILSNDRQGFVNVFTVP